MSSDGEVRERTERRKEMQRLTPLDRQRTRHRAH